MSAHRAAVWGGLFAMGVVLLGFWFAPRAVSSTNAMGEFAFRAWGTSGAYDGGFLALITLALLSAALPKRRRPSCR